MICILNSRCLGKTLLKLLHPLVVFEKVHEGDLDAEVVLQGDSFHSIFHLVDHSVLLLQDVRVCRVELVAERIVARDLFTICCFM